MRNRSKEGFTPSLADELGVGCEDMKPEARLIEDLPLGSLHMLVALDYLPEMTGQDESRFDLFEITEGLTARDLYTA